MRKININVGGMSCASCAGAVQRSLSKLNGVSNANVNLATNTATVDYDEDALTEADLRKAIEDAGYRVLGDDAEKQKKKSSRR
jgi:Cu+-exporting ATPase